MFPRILNALRAFPVLASTSSSVPPVMFMTLPKYVKDVKSSMSRFAILMCSFDLLFTLMILSVLILSPSFDEMASSFEVFACIWEWVWDKSAKSSPKSRSSIWSTRVHCMPFLESDIVSFIAQSMARRKGISDKRHPCLTPVLILNFSVKPLSCKMRKLVPSYDLSGNSVAGHQVPQGVSIQAVKCFLIIYKIYIEWGPPFKWLFYDYTKGGYLVWCWSGLSKSRLIIS